MPARDIHQDFDSFLISGGYLPDGYEYDIVHNRLDDGSRKYGSHHRDMDIYHTEDGIRYWLQGMSNRNASQEKLTAYLRCALAHIALDMAETEIRENLQEDTVKMPEEELFEYAMTIIDREGLMRKYYKDPY